MTVHNSSLPHCELISNLFIALLQIFVWFITKPQLKLCVPLTTAFRIGNCCTRWHCTFKGLRVKFTENLRASTFNEDLSDENTFSLIHLGGQYQGLGSVFIWYGSGSSILGWIPLRIRIQSGFRVFMTQIYKKFTAKPIRYRSFQKGTYSTSKHEISHFFFFSFYFALLDPDPDPPTWLNPDPIRIRIGSRSGSENTGQYL